MSAEEAQEVEIPDELLGTCAMRKACDQCTDDQSVFYPLKSATKHYRIRLCCLEPQGEEEETRSRKIARNRNGNRKCYEGKPTFVFGPNGSCGCSGAAINAINLVALTIAVVWYLFY